MAFIADRSISPTSKLVINQLAGTKTPQSVMDISNAVGASYWTIRILCKSLAAMGLLTLTLIGKSPHYSVACGTEVKR